VNLFGSNDYRTMAELGEKLQEPVGRRRYICNAAKKKKPITAFQGRPGMG